MLVSKCGFIVHPEKGWVGASPDGLLHLLIGLFKIIHVNDQMNCLRSNVPTRKEKRHLKKLAKMLKFIVN